MTAAKAKKPARKPAKSKAKEASAEALELKHPVPNFLGDAGADLWVRIVTDLSEGWELDARELHYLTEAAKVADDLEALDRSVAEVGRTVKGSRGQPVVNPAIGEARQLRTLQLRLLGSIETSDPLEVVAGAATPEQARKRKAAAAKWARERRRLH